MNMITEYLVMFSKGIKNFPKVSRALITKLRRKLNILTQFEKDTINERIQICKACPFNSYNASEKGIYTTTRTDLHCMHCGCVIDIYTYCLDCICSQDEYNKKNKTNIPVRWFPI